MTNNDEATTELSTEEVSTVADIWSYMFDHEVETSKDFLIEVPTTNRQHGLKRITIRKFADGMQVVMKIYNKASPTGYRVDESRLTTPYGIMARLFDTTIYDSFEWYVIHKLKQKLDDRFIVDDDWSEWEGNPLFIDLATPNSTDFNLRVYFHKHSLAVEYFDDSETVIEVRNFTMDEIFTDDVSCVVEYINNVVK